MKGYPSFFPAVLGSCFLNHAFSFAFPLLSLLLLQATGMSDREVPLLIAIAFLISALLQPKIGRLADQGKRGMVLVATILVAGGIAGIFFHLHALLPVLFTTTAFITGVGIFSTLATRLIEGGVSFQNRPKASSLLFATMNLGFGTSACLAYFFIYKYQGTLLSLDILTFVVYGAVLYLALGQITSQKKEETKEEGGYEFPWAHGTLFLGCFLLFLPTVSLLSAMPLLYNRIFPSATSATAITFGVNNILIVILGTGLSQKLELFSTNQQLWIATIFQVLGHALLPFANSYTALIGVTVLWSIGEAFVYPVMARAVYSCFSEEHLGLAAGTKSLLMRSAFVATPLVGLVTGFLPVASYSLFFGAAPLLGLCLLKRGGQSG